MSVPEPRNIVLEEIRDMSPSVRGFTFRLLDEPAFDFLPGQWVSLTLPADGTRLIRAYSIASPPRGDARFELAVTRVQDGPASEWMYHLAPGERLQFTGPFGTFLLREPLDRPIYFVATGTGVAPIRSMLHDLLERRNARVALTLIFGARSEPDILYRAEFESWDRKHRNFTFIPTLSKPSAAWRGDSGYVQKRLDTLLRPWREADIYVCGVRRMVDDVRRHLRDAGYDRRQVHYERYD